MTLQSTGTISLGQIANEFGYTDGTATKLGDYRKIVGGGNYPQSIGDLQFNSIDAQTGGSVPTSGQIKLSDFYSTQLQQVVNFWSSNTGGFRLVARDRYDSNGVISGNNEVAVVGGYRSRPSNSSGTKVHIHVKQDIGSERTDPDHCALRTGNQWESGTNLQVDVGSGGRIIGAGGNGGSGSQGGGEQGGAGSSGLGIQYSNTQVNVLSGGIISCGFGGGGGGGGAFDYDHKSWRYASGGSGGGGAGLPLGEGGTGGNGNGSDATSLSEGGEGAGGSNNGNESIGGTGGNGGDSEESTSAGGGGYGNETSNQNAGGPAGNDGAAFKKSSGITFGNSEISESGSIFDGANARINGNLGDGVQ